MNSLLEINDLEVEFKGTRGRKNFKALDKVSIDIRPGETVGLVGESGSGKTTLGRAILGLAPVTSGTITMEGRDISHIDDKARRELAKDVSVVFQDPYSSLNPMLSIGDILAEPLIAQGWNRTDAMVRIRELLAAVKLPDNTVERRAREFSGGQRQRIAIARSLALKPKLIVCDEPVSALDLTTQARVMDLLKNIQQETGVAYLFISHDLAVVRHLSHRVAVMQKGKIVEWGDAKKVTIVPQHPYTQLLLMATPLADPVLQRERRIERRLKLNAGA